MEAEDDIILLSAGQETDEYTSNEIVNAAIGHQFEKWTAPLYSHPAI